MCEREGELVAWLDGELEPTGATAVAAHVNECAECTRRVQAYRQVFNDFSNYRDAVSARAMESVPGAPPAARGRWVFAGALAVSLFAAVALMRTSRPPASPSHAVERPFVRIPYVPPLDPMERAAVVRVEMPAAALMVAGFHLGPVDPASPVQADVVVGEDGRAHAVRVLGDMELR